MRRIGIYAGTFDPIHIGHVGFALQSLEAAGLDEVVFLPERMPRDKEVVTDIAHRFEMIQRSIMPYLELSVRLLDIPQFCVQGTLPELRNMFEDAELVMLLGSDVVKTFVFRWANLDELFANMSLAIGVREGDSSKELKKVLRSVTEHVKPRYVFVGSPLADTNSTRIRNGQVLRDVDPRTFEYIKEHQLYGRAR